MVPEITNVDQGRSRVVKRDIWGLAGIHPADDFVRPRRTGRESRRDGFARDCPHRHPVLPMLALRDRSRAAPSFFCGCRAISTVAGAAPRRRGTSGARWRRYAGERLAGRFPWSGWGARESLPRHPSHGRRIGPRHGPILSPSPSVVAPARVASRGHPGLSRDLGIPLTQATPLYSVRHRGRLSTNVARVRSALQHRRRLPCISGPAALG